MKAKTKTTTKREQIVDPETDRPYPDKVVALCFEFWRTWMRYKSMCDTRPEKHPEREAAWQAYNDLEEKLSETVPTSLRGLTASADLLKQLTESGLIGDEAAARWPKTLAEGLRNVSGYEPPAYRLYQTRGV